MRVVDLPRDAAAALPQHRARAARSGRARPSSGPRDCGDSRHGQGESDRVGIIDPIREIVGRRLEKALRSCAAYGPPRAPNGRPPTPARARRGTARRPSSASRRWRAWKSSPRIGSDEVESLGRRPADVDARERRGRDLRRVALAEAEAAQPQRSAAGRASRQARRAAMSASVMPTLREHGRGGSRAPRRCGRSIRNCSAARRSQLEGVGGGAPVDGVEVRLRGLGAAAGVGERVAELDAAGLARVAPRPASQLAARGGRGGPRGRTRAPRPRAAPRPRRTRRPAPARRPPGSGARAPRDRRCPTLERQRQPAVVVPDRLGAKGSRHHGLADPVVVGLDLVAVSGGPGPDQVAFARSDVERRLVGPRGRRPAGRARGRQRARPRPRGPRAAAARSGRRRIARADHLVERDSARRGFAGATRPASRRIDSRVRVAHELGDEERIPAGFAGDFVRADRTRRSVPRSATVSSRASLAVSSPTAQIDARRILAPAPRRARANSLAETGSSPPRRRGSRRSAAATGGSRRPQQLGEQRRAVRRRPTAGRR